jgi:hypothetical protein
MIPRVSPKGRSFKGAGAYYLHDLGKAKTAERVAFIRTVNMLTDDPEKALKVMAWTAEHAQDLKTVSGQKMTGRKAENPVYAYCLSWAADQNPDQQDMIELATRSLKVLGVEEHEALIIAHNDTDQAHVHVLVNRVHPVTGIMAKMDHDQNRLSRLAQAYEEETGQVYCHERVSNNRRRDKGETNLKAEPVQRKIGTPEHEKRRHDRMMAQKAAAKSESTRLAAEKKKQSAARDLKAAFDALGGRDDRQYRAREIERPRRDEEAAARAAWNDDRTQEKERAKGERNQAQSSWRETKRRAWLDQRRAEEWADYEARKWQVLNDKQMERREGLREVQADRLRRFDDRLNIKYSVNESLLERRIAEAQDATQTQGVRAIFDKVTGAHKDKASQLEALQLAAARLAQQKKTEREAYESKQQKGRMAQAKQHESERQKLTQQLQATKSRQDAKFVEQERARQAKQEVQASVARMPANQNRLTHAFSQSSAFQEFRTAENGRSSLLTSPTDKSPDREPER